MLAAWHRVPDAGNLLFLDGSVRFVPVEPRPEIGAAVFDPLEPSLAFPLQKR
jgi:prepilin-type processing-associated H-X9-DG protein